jgi:hypothetical protein
MKHLSLLIAATALVLAQCERHSWEDVKDADGNLTEKGTKRLFEGHGDHSGDTHDAEADGHAKDADGHAKDADGHAEEGEAHDQDGTTPETTDGTTEP